VIDENRMKIGNRTVEVRGDELLLNGKPIFLKGFGKHEDFVLHGCGLDLVVLVRDFELLKWVDANSFRTSHYPYAEEALMLADQYGFLIIDETPAVNHIFSDPPDTSSNAASTCGACLPTSSHATAIMRARSCGLSPTNRCPSLSTRSITPQPTSSAASSPFSTQPSGPRPVGCFSALLAPYVSS
jgi:hypothetical protein